MVCKNNIKTASLLQKQNMRRKNSSVTRLKDASIYSSKIILAKYKKNNSFVIGVSGGSSLAQRLTIPL